MRDNIAKFINNAATQIAGKESGDGLNEYGFVWGQKYEVEMFGASGTIAFFEDGSTATYKPDGSIMQTPAGTVHYSQNTVEIGVKNSGGEYYKYELQPSGKFALTDAQFSFDFD